MVFIDSPLSTKLFASSLISAFTGITGFFVWTKHCEMLELDASAEQLFRSPYYKQFNPRGNPSTNDVIVRKIPLWHIRPDLIDDAREGGGKLVEAFCGGVFGGKFFTPQRLIHATGRPPAAETSALIASLNQQNPEPFAPNPAPSTTPSITSRVSSLFSSSTPNPQTPPTPFHPSEPTPQPTELWSRDSIQTSAYPRSTILTNHFVVLSHTPQQILLRCGASPHTSPSAPRNSDGLFALTAIPNFDLGYAEFRLTSIFYDGTKQLTPSEMQMVRDGRGQELRPMKGVMQWLHVLYAKGMMESGVGQLRMSKWRSLEKQRELIREGQRKEKYEKEMEKRTDGETGDAQK